MSIELNDDQDKAASLLPIRTLAKLTGVNSITLRAWERRYGLLKPHRTDSGHRLYSQDDVNMINEVVGLLDQGIPISQAKVVLEQRQSQRETRSAESPSAWDRYLQQTIAVVSRYDEVAIDSIYNEVLSLYPVDMVMQHLVVSTLQELGRRWQDNEGSIAEEHFFSAYIRNRLGARLHHGMKSMVGKQLVIACLPGEYHELGILMFALSAQTHGFRTLLLGANLPLSELATVVDRSGSQAVVLAGRYPDNLAPCREGLKDLTGKLRVPVFVGGHVSVTHSDVISKAGATAIGENVSRGLQIIKDVVAGMEGNV